MPLPEYTGTHGPDIFVYVYVFVFSMLILSSGLIAHLIATILAARRKRRMSRADKARQEIKDRVRRIKEEQALQSYKDDLLMHNYREISNDFWRRG